jgi:hypothetical protein
MKKMILALTLVTMLAFSGAAFAGDGIIGLPLPTPRSEAEATAASTAVIQNNEAQQYLNAPSNFPYIIPMLQGGKVGDVTGLMPMFGLKALTPLDRQKDVVVEVLGVYKGWAFDRIRLDEIEKMLIEKAGDISGRGVDLDNIRYQVQYKDSVFSAGIGGGGSGSLSGPVGDMGAAGTLSVLPGMHRSTADPMYILKFYRVRGANEKAALNLTKEGWKPVAEKKAPESILVLSKAQEDSGDTLAAWLKARQSQR